MVLDASAAMYCVLCGERNLHESFQIVAINDLGSPAINAHLLKYDTVHGTFGFDVSHERCHHRQWRQY